MINIKEFLGLNDYISALDQFLTHVDRQHPKPSASQCKEKEKYARIYQLRDYPESPISQTSFWDKF